MAWAPSVSTILRRNVRTSRPRRLLRNSLRLIVTLGSHRRWMNQNRCRRRRASPHDDRRARTAILLSTLSRDGLAVLDAHSTFARARDGRVDGRG